MEIQQNASNSQLDYKQLQGKDFKGFNFMYSSFVAADVSNSNFENTYLFEVRFEEANLSNAVLKNANAQFADFRNASLLGADLSGADLTGVDLSGADLTDANLHGAIGLGDRYGERYFAIALLEILHTGKGLLNMRNWHTCATTHCLAGWAFPELEHPSRKASRMYPTLAKFFFSTEKEAVKALELVGAGKLSVFPD